MTIIFLFVLFLFCFFFHSHNLSTLDNDACHRWLSNLKHLFLCKDCFERVGVFGPKLFRSFLSKERIMAQKYFREMGNFGQHVPRHRSKMISRYHGLGILFCSWKRFGKFETVSKSWCTPNYQISVFSKTRHFLLPDFWRIRELVSKSGVLRLIA